MEAFEIAKNNLKECFDVNGILAGRHHYEDYWTRDAYFGWLGALEIGESKIVEKHFDSLFAFQKKDGFVPFIIRKLFPILPFFGIKINVQPYPKFFSHKALYSSKVIDSNALFIIGIHDYLKHSDNLNFLRQRTRSIEKALSWYTFENNNLVKEGKIAQWNDGIYKKQFVAITNIEVWKAYNVFVELLKMLGEPTTDVEDKTQKLQDAILNKFWGGKFLIDSFDNTAKLTYFDTIANLLAVIWGFVDKDQAEKIIEYTLEQAIDIPLVKTSVPSYKNYETDILNRVVGMGGYWQGKDIYWIEPVLLLIIALIKTDKRELAYKYKSGIDKLIIEFDGIFETYKKVGEKFEPLKTWIYRSEKPYARGSGLYIYMHSLLNS